MECKKCNKPCEGYKCDMCGEEMPAMDPAHSCGQDHLKCKCTGCQESEEDCSC